MKRGLLKNRKATMAIKMVGWWWMALAVLVIMFGGYLIISGKLTDALEYVKNILRFRR